MGIPAEVKAIIFDMDGVIVDSEPIHIESFQIFLDRINVPYTDEFVDNLVGYSIDHNIQTNASMKQIQSYEYEKLYLQKGEDFGCFEMGSTVVIISEPGLLELKITPGKTVRFGQNIAQLM